MERRGKRVKRWKGRDGLIDRGMKMSTRVAGDGDTGGRG